MTTQVKVTSLKDDVRLFGLILSKGAQLAIDITDDQLDAVQKMVDSGDVEVEGMKKAAPAPAPVVDKKDKK